MIDPVVVQRNFSISAVHYDEYAEVQSLAARKLIGRVTTRSFSNIFEIGCGTGIYTELLAEAFPAAAIDAVDISGPMVSIARAKLPDERIRFFVCDFDTVTPDGPFECISSNATFQWLGDTRNAVSVCRRLLVPGGELSFSMFGPNTFSELNTCLREVFDGAFSITSGSFLGRESVASILRSAFQNSSVDEEIIRIKYGSVRELLRAIKYTGTRGMGDVSKRLWTPRTLERLERAYRKEFGGIVATYQAFFCKAKR
ncbi:MAG: methyltransferase domain-containing protein [Candidatus Omnitrophota bacterium]